MSTNPHTNWYWNDWDADQALALCSLAAQGLWMRMLSIASKAGGYVRVNGTACSTQDIAILVGRSTEEVAPLIAELGERGVYSRTRDGTIYNRRFVRDEKNRKIAQKNGRKGGNPLLLVSHGNHSDIPSPVNPRLNGEDKPVDKPSRARVLLPQTSKEESKKDSPPCVPPRDEGEQNLGDAVAPVEGKRRPAKQGVPADWEPDTAGMDYAATHAGWEAGRLWGEIEQFRDYHLAKGSLLADPDAGFRVWVRNSVKFEARQANGRRSAQAAEFDAFERVTRYAH